MDAELINLQMRGVDVQIPGQQQQQIQEVIISHDHQQQHWQVEQLLSHQQQQHHQLNQLQQHQMQQQCVQPLEVNYKVLLPESKGAVKKGSVMSELSASPNEIQQKEIKAKRQRFEQVKKRKATEKTSRIGSGECDELLEISDSTLRGNRFALLSDIEEVLSNAMQSEQISAADYSLKKTNNVNNFDSNFDKENVNPVGNIDNIQKNQKNQHNSSKFCPPIVLFNVDIRSLINQFKTNFPDLNCKIVNKSKSKSKLFLKDFDAYSELMAFLKEKGISSHSFTPQHLKQVSLILRGLHYLSSEDEIKGELESLLPGAVSNVQLFITPYMKNNNLSSNLFLVTLTPGINISEIIKIKVICYQSVSWEKPMSKAGLFFSQTRPVPMGPSFFRGPKI